MSVKDEIIIRDEFGYSPRVIPKGRPQESEVELIKLLDEELAEDVSIITNADYRLFKEDELKDREIDCVIRCKNKVWIVDLKNYTYPVTINKSDQWEVLYGSIVDYHDNALKKILKNQRVINGALSRLNFKGNVIGYVVFNNNANISYEAGLKLSEQVFHINKLINIINEYSARSIDKPDQNSDSFTKFVSKSAGYNKAIRGVCPRYSNMHVEVDKAEKTDHYARGLLLHKVRHTKVPHYHFVRFHTELLDPVLLEQLAELSERIKIYRDDLNLGRSSSLRLPEIIHDEANLCVWFVYSLKSLDKEDGKFYLRRKLFPFLQEDQVSIEKKMQICLQLLECIEALHKESFSHRLLSPDALWINEKSNHLSLFGFERVKFSALEFGDRTITGLTAKLRSSYWNPVEYDSPVQFKHADHFKADVYTASLIISLILCKNPISVLSNIEGKSRSDREAFLKKSIPSSVSDLYPGLIRLLESALEAESEKRIDIYGFKNSFLRLLSGISDSDNRSITEIKSGDIIDGRYQVSDLVPQSESLFKVFSAVDLSNNSTVILKFSTSEVNDSALDIEVGNILKIREFSKFRGEIAGVELPEILAAVDLSNDFGLKYYVRKYFEVLPAENINASSFDIIKNLEKLVCFISALHENGFCVRDVCNSNVRWDKNGNLVILDLGSVCQIDDPNRDFNGKEDFLPLLPNGSRSHFEKDKHRIKRDFYAAVLTCFRWFFGGRPWESTFKVHKPDDIQIDWVSDRSGLGVTEGKLIKNFFESAIGTPAYNQYQYVGDGRLLSSIRNVIEDLAGATEKSILGPINELQGFVFDNPVEPHVLACTRGTGELIGNIGYLLSCSKSEGTDLFEAIVQDCHEIHRDHQAFTVIRDTSREESCLALLVLNSEQFPESGIHKVFKTSVSTFIEVSDGAIDLLSKVSSASLSCYWSEDRFWVLPNKILELLDLPGSEASLYLQLHNLLSCFSEYTVNADDFSDSVSYREALVECRDALLNPKSFPTEKFGQLSLPDGHFTPNEFEVVFGTDESSGKEVMLLACSRESGDGLYSSILTLLNEVKYRYRLFSFDDRSDDEYFMCLLESNISIAAFPEGLQGVLESADLSSLNLEDYVSLLNDVGDLAYSDRYLLLYCQNDFRIVPNTLVSEAGFQAHVSTLGDQCLDMIRKSNFLPEDITKWNKDTLLQLSDHLEFLNALEDKGDEWRDILDELPWGGVQGYLTKSLVDGEGPFRTHNMYARPEEAKLGEGRSGIVYETLPDGLVLKIAKSPKGVGDEPGGIEEDEWNREVALHEKVRGYSLPGLSQYMAKERGFIYFRCDPGETLKSRFDKGETFSDFVSLVASFNDYLSSLHELTNHDIFATDICPDNIIVVGDRSSRGPRCIHIDLGPGYHRFWSPPEEDFSGGFISKPLNGMMYSFTKVLAAEVLLMGSANRSVLDDWYQFAVTYYSESMNTHDLVYSSGHRADADEVWRNLEGELTKSLVEVCNVSHSRLNELLPRILKFFKSGLKLDLNDRFVDLNQMNEMLQGFRRDLLEAR